MPPKPKPQKPIATDSNGRGIQVGVDEGAEEQQQEKAAEEEEAAVEEEEEEMLLLKDITVKFRILKSQIVTDAYPNIYSIEEVKKDVSEKFQIHPAFVVLKKAGSARQLDDDQRLYGLCDNDYGVIDMDLELTENASRENIRLEPQVYYNNLSLPDIITVRVPADGSLEGNTSRDLVVEIENLAIVKPFLGGYIDKVTKLEYHDAYTQTGPPLERIKFDGILSRDTQTVEEKTVDVDTPLDQATAVYGGAVEKTFATRFTDRVLQPGPYETYEEMSKRINFVGKVTMIQRNFRRYRWQKLIRESAAEWRRLQQEQMRREDKRIKVHSDEYRKECIVKTFPKTKEDFDALYAQIQHWKENELKLICEKYSGAPKIAEMNMLLDKEVQLLNGIERQRQLLTQEIKKQRNEQKLKNMGDPIKWIGYKELVIQMDTLRNQRARYLGNYYQKLSDEDLKNHDRIELLNQVSEVLTNEDHPAIGEDQFNLTTPFGSI
ncbi:IQ and ubiquitin-like domain-containing protein [Uranotaenia lowii]|uniref:IQ and ubiquitin-like domain-containing protein n=1 Tax=Uranotaenia lowii TaxID=190385 RepID=UPI0024788F64|nr:IQ and ubiquitin-like domain-containing protein [Uranotaenia lowii]